MSPETELTSDARSADAAGKDATWAQPSWACPISSRSSSCKAARARGSVTPARQCSR